MHRFANFRTFAGAVEPCLDEAHKDKLQDIVSAAAGYFQDAVNDTYRQKLGLANDDKGLEASLDLMVCCNVRPCLSDVCGALRIWMSDNAKRDIGH